MQYDRPTPSTSSVRNLQAQAEFFHEAQLATATVAAGAPPSADAEAWLAAQAWQEGDGSQAPWTAPGGCRWLLAEGCEDCVRDLSYPAACRRQ